MSKEQTKLKSDLGWLVLELQDNPDKKYEVMNIKYSEYPGEAITSFQLLINLPSSLSIIMRIHMKKNQIKVITPHHVSKHIKIFHQYIRKLAIELGYEIQEEE